MDPDESDFPCALTSVVRSSLNCILVVDEVGTITDFNAAAERAFGYRRDAMIGRSASDLISPTSLAPEDRERIRTFFTARAPGESAARAKVDFRMADGSQLPVEATITEVQLDGRSRFICSLRDLSVEQLSTRALEESRRRLELAVEGAKLGTWTFDLGTGETWYSERSNPATMGREVQMGVCRLNLDSRKLYRADGSEQPLTAMEFDLLATFASHPGRVLSRDQLLDLAHNKEIEPFDRSIDIRITRIRRKIEADPAKPQAIKTVRGAGYVYSPPSAA